MAFKLNPLTGQLDLITPPTPFDVDTILTNQFFDIITDQFGNLLVGI